MRKFIISLLATLSVITFTAPTTQAYVPKSYTDCLQSSAYGQRMCFDQSTRQVFFFSSGTNIIGRYAINSGTPNCSSGVAGAGSFAPDGQGAILADGLTAWCGAQALFIRNGTNSNTNTIGLPSAVYNIAYTYATTANVEFVYSK